MGLAKVRARRHACKFSLHHPLTSAALNPIYRHVKDIHISSTEDLMTTQTLSSASWPSRAETWLDQRGKGAWIAAMILGFIFFWPVGLGLLAYMIWSKRMFNKGCAQRRAHMHSHGFHAAFRPTGNSAFDAYKSDTLDRLEREQAEFEAFLERLRASKDKSEFDDYLDQRAQAARDAEVKGQDSSGDDSPRGSY